MLKKSLLAIIVIYTILGFIIIPQILKPQLVQIIQEELNAKIAIDNISFNPYIFKLKISDIELTSLEDKHLISLDFISVNIEPHSLFNLTLHLKELIIQNPKVSIVLNKDKSINILSILKKSQTQEVEEKEEVDTSIPRIKLDLITIVDGSLYFEDNTKKSKFDFTFNDIGFELKDIDTNDFNSSNAKLRFYSQLGDGGFIDLKSNLVGLKPFVINGSLNFKASKLYTQWRYMKDSLNLEVADGKISFETKYHLNLEDLNATRIYDASLKLENLRVKPKDGYKDILNLDYFHIDGIDVKPMLQEVVISEIKLNSLYVKAKRDNKGVIDWLEYIKVNSLKESNVSDSNIAVVNENNKTNSPWKLLVKDLSLEKIIVEFNDNKVNPSVKTELNEFNLYAQNITLAGAKPFTYKIDMLVNDKFKCNIDGDIKHKVLDINTQLRCNNFNIIHYRPYIDEVANSNLKVYGVKLSNAMTHFDAKVNIQEIDNEVVIDLSDANINFNHFELKRRKDNSKLVNFNDLNMQHISLNTKSKKLNIEEISLNNLDITTKRYKSGILNIDGLIIPKKQKKGVTKKEVTTKSKKEYEVTLKHFALNSARVFFHDSALSPSVTSKLDKINFNAYDIDSKKYSWLKYNFTSRVNAKGYITSKGKICHTPLKQKGSFNLKKISLIELNPYIQESMFVNLSDGYLNLNTTTEYTKSLTSPDLKVNGSMNIKELFINDSRDNTTLFSFNKFGFKTFSLETSPNRLHIDEAYIDSFYVDAFINEKKEMNLALLSKNKPQKETTKREVSQKRSEEKNSFPIKVTKLSIDNGSAKFADFSIPLKFKTHIHDLNGAIYAISNLENETSYVDIKGEIDQYGATKLKGSINSSNPEKYTDIDFSFSNLALNSLTGYSASFAGHEIDSGKLYLDLGYDIIDSELKGSNSIIIKKMKLGNEVKDENTTSLPLGFIIGLLEDSDGVIDIDMPVEGNVDEPDFKYGSFVFKTFGNLLLKAVTSPFSFLGSMMGMDGDALEYAQFEVGKYNILPPEREKLDKIAKMMIKRPKISLAIGGQYDKNLDLKALKIKKLISLVVKKSGIKNRDKQESAMTTELLEDIYEESKDDDKLEKIKDTLDKEFEGEVLKRVYNKALIKEVIAIQMVTPQELANLANSRAEIVKNYLLLEKNINPSRVNLIEVKSINDSSEKFVKIKFEIEVK